MKYSCVANRVFDLFVGTPQLLIGFLEVAVGVAHSNQQVVECAHQLRDLIMMGVDGQELVGMFPLNALGLPRQPIEGIDNSAFDDQEG